MYDHGASIRCASDVVAELGNEAYILDIELDVADDLHNNYVGKEFKTKTPEECRVRDLNQARRSPAVDVIKSRFPLSWNNKSRSF